MKKICILMKKTPKWGYYGIFSPLTFVASIGNIYHFKIEQCK